MVAERERLLGKLPFAASASFDSYPRQHETGCLEGTRVDLLQQLERWSVAHERPIFWLSGMAGTGKSTIARTLATRLKSQGLLGGNFFFSRASGEVSNGFPSSTTYALSAPALQCAIRVISLFSITGSGRRSGWDVSWGARYLTSDKNAPET